MTRREDGIVVIDPVKAKGRKEIVKACPYGAVYWNEDQQLPQAWVFDAHLLDRGWKAPRAVQACGIGAMRAEKIEDADMQRLAETEKLEVLHPEYGTRPRVYYKNLHHVTRCFIGATVIAQQAGVKDCVNGASVTLSRNGQRVAETRTDVFGQFMIDHLEPDSGRYTLEITAAGQMSHIREVTLGASIYLGTIEIEAA